MNDINFLIKREIFRDHFTLGQMYQDGLHLGFTCEDTDRELEDGGIKIAKETAIPRGVYRLTVSMSNRFSRLMPEVQDVPQFSGVRIHGGNTDRDTEGCPLLGKIRTAEGVAGCKEVNAALIKAIVDCERSGGKCWLLVE